MDTQEEYMQEAKTRLKEYETQIKQLKAKMETAQAETHIGQQDAVEALEAGVLRARQQLEALGNAGSDSFNTLKTNTENALHQLKQSLNQTDSGS